MPSIRVVADDQRKPESNYLGRKSNNVYSQTGEDGVIEAIFDVLKPKNKWCVEFGAWDGVYLSNTCNLIRNGGWSAVMIEGDPERCKEIENNYPGNTSVYAMNRMVGFSKGVDTIDDILKTTPIPQDFDFISIDVDGIDWYIWESIVDFRPRLVAIEFNPVVPNHVSFVQDRDMKIREGASLRAMVELSATKGYELVALTNANAFFVPEEEFSKFGINDNSIRAMRADRPNYIFHGYNGKIYHTMPRMSWYGKHVELRPDSLQILSMHGESHLKADDKILSADANTLKSADGIVRELWALRATKASLPVEELNQRSRAVWVAAKTYMDKHLPWGAASDTTS